MDNILVLTNFQKYTYDALHYGIFLAHKTKAKLHILDSSNDLSSEKQERSLIHFLKDRSDQSLKVYWEEAAPLFKEYDLSKIELMYYPQSDFDVDQITESAEFSEMDLIVLSTKEKFDLSNLIFRSKLTRLIEKAKQPILAIPPNADFHKIESIEYATDLEDHQLTSIEYAYDLSMDLDVSFNFIHVKLEETRSYDSNKNKFKLMAGEILGTDEFGFQENQNDSVLQGLQDHLANSAGQLLILRKNFKKGLEKYLTINIAGKMCFSAERPILVCSDEQ